MITLQFFSEHKTHGASALGGGLGAVGGGLGALGDAGGRPAGQQNTH